MSIMSEEEKKAIEWLEKAEFFSARLYAPIILNVIDKLKDNLHEEQEQNEYLKDKVDKQQKEIEELKKPKYIIDFKTNKITKLTNDFISKDKIREKIKELEITRNSSVTDNGFAIMSVVISNFKELLEENTNE